MPVYDLLNPSQYADKTVVAERRQQCETCPERLAKYNGKPLSSTQNCPVCYCFIFGKTKIKREACPNGDWGAVD
jgi:hypothetical protein